MANRSKSIFDPDGNAELYTDKYRFGQVDIIHVPQVSNNGLIARLAAKALILQFTTFQISFTCHDNRRSESRDEKKNHSIVAQTPNSQSTHGIRGSGETHEREQHWNDFA